MKGKDLGRKKNLTFVKFHVIIYLEKRKWMDLLMRKFLASWLLGGNVVSWKRMFDIAVECHDECKTMLKRMEHLFKLYRATSEKQIATLNAIDELGNAELKKKILEIYNAE